MLRESIFMTKTSFHSRPVILHLTTSLVMGGVERQLLQTIPRLKDFDHIVICLQAWGNVGESLKKKGVNVFFIKTRHFFSIHSAIRCKKIIDVYCPDLMITYLPFADLFGRLWRYYFKIPRIVTFLRSTMREIRYLPLILLNNITQFLVDRFFAVSISTKRRFESLGLRQGKTDVIYHGIDIPSLEELNHKVAQPLLLKNEIAIVGYVGALRKERGHIFLLDVVRLLKEQGVPFHLFLAGDGPYHKVLMQRVEELDITDFVTFLGRVDDIPSFLKQLTVYAHPSKYEGMSNALLEAMAYCRAIVTTDIEENREALGKDACAQLVVPNDAKKFAEAIHDLILNPSKREKLSVAAYKRVQEFSTQKSLDHFRKSLLNVLSS